MWFTFRTKKTGDVTLRDKIPRNLLQLPKQFAINLHKSLGSASSKNLQRMHLILSPVHIWDNIMGQIFILSHILSHICILYCPQCILYCPQCIRCYVARRCRVGNCCASCMHLHCHGKAMKIIEAKATGIQFLITIAAAKITPDVTADPILTVKQDAWSTQIYIYADDQVPVGMEHALIISIWN